MKTLLVSLLFAVIVFVGVGELAGFDVGYATTFSKLVKTAPVNVEVKPEGKLVRWDQTICSNELTKQDYIMHLVSREQITNAALKAGFTGDSLKVAVALAYAEGQADLSCQGDWMLADSKWGGSIGLWQIRSLKAEQGKGSCRDIDALNSLDIDFQARCAFQISSGGRNFRPWSAYLNGKYKQYL